MKQDQRSKNRGREHAQHGWIEDKGVAKSSAFPGHVFMRCPCGWFGWVIPNE